MRVSTNMIYDQGVIALQKQSAALLYTGQQIATGRKILTPSDDPVGSARALDVSQSKSVNQQFITNQGYAEDALKLVEGFPITLTAGFIGVLLIMSNFAPVLQSLFERSFDTIGLLLDALAPRPAP